MAAAANNYQQPSSSKAPKNSMAINPATPQSNHQGNPSSAAPPITDEALSRATHITRQELLKRRSHKLEQLSKCYRDHYWALMEELKFQYRKYYWRYSVSPLKEDQPQTHKYDEVRDFDVDVIGENNNGNDSNLNRNLELKNNRRCLFVACKLKAMALTNFCHLHKLSDAKQKLYSPVVMSSKVLRRGH